MDDAIGQNLVAYAALGLLGGALVWMSARAYFGLARSVCAPGGARFDAQAFQVGDVIVSGLLAAWFLMNAWSAFTGEADADAAAIGSADIVASMMFFGVIVFMILGYLVFRRIPVVATFGLDVLSFPSGLITALKWLVIAYPLLALAAVLGRLIPGDYPETQGVVDFFLTSDTFGDRLLIIVMAVVIAPLAEEFLFRGYFYGSLKKWLGMPWALVLTSALFALIHSHVPSLGVFFLLSVALIFVLEKTGSLLVPVAMHSLFNAVSVCVMIFLPPDMQ